MQQETTTQPISMEEEMAARLTNLPSFKSDYLDQPSDSMLVFEEDDSDFSFVVSSDDRYGGKIPNITADELFAHGKILPMYPVFGNSFKNSVVGEENDMDTASVTHPEPEAIGEFCDWVPKSAPSSPDRCRKSRSTGSTRKWLFHDLLGGRSHSDGKEKFVFLTKDSENKKKEKEREVKEIEKKVKEMDMGKTFKMFYGNKGDKTKKEREIKGKRRSFLPYVGFFGGGAGLNEGFSRTSYPY